MKTLLIIWMCLCTGLCMAQNSENDDTHVTINAGKKPLKDILDKMPNVLYLSIRGTLLPEDYIFLQETVDYGTIQPNKTYCPLTERFSFKVSENAPTVARNDLDGVRFYLTITRDNSNVHSLDSFSVDIFRPQYKIVQQYIVNTTDGDLKPEAGEDVYVKTEYKK